MRKRLASIGAAFAAAGIAIGATVAAVSSAAPTHEERSTSCTTDAAGYCTVKHGLGVKPTAVLLTSRIGSSGLPIALSEITASSTATTFKIRATLGGQPVASKTIYLSYRVTPAVSTPPTPTTTTTTTTTTPPPDPDPPAEPLAVCGTEQLNGPLEPPAGAVVVPPGNNSAFDFGSAGETYWLATGVHFFNDGEFEQIIPGNGSTFIGAPGAILDGRGVNRYAFTQQASNVTIKYLTVRNFVAPTDEGVVNHDSGDGWVVSHNTFTKNKGAALMAGDDNKITNNCLSNNGQYGLNAYQGRSDGPSNLLLQGNEFVGNNVDGEPYPGCGCTGGMKFWDVDGADVKNNWIHDNDGTGIWADTNNNDFLIEDNVIENNTGHAIFYEISYNATIRNNVIRNNTWGLGREFADNGDNFAIGTIYLSEAGGEPRVPARNSIVDISGNQFTNNWGGIAAWENADRFCGVNTTADCTLLAETEECSPAAIGSEPAYTDCRWKTQRLRIHDNVFKIDKAVVDGGCDPRFCAVQAVFANYGTWPEWSPYQGRKIQDAITFEQDNQWFDNTYVGDWRFVAWEPGNFQTWDQWRSAPHGQDAGSVKS